MMMAAQSKQGTHSMAQDGRFLRKDRAEVQLDPEFGAQYDGLRTVMRIMYNDDVRLNEQTVLV